MIREAKGVAIHDLSFWASNLPLLDGLPRVIGDYQVGFGNRVYLQLTSETGRDLHEQTLSRLSEIWDSSDPDLREPADSMAASLLELMSERPTIGPPLVNEPVAGCGAVTSGSCDLLWAPFVIELKLTATEPALRDVRQVLVYAGLLYLEGAVEIGGGLVANPRLGVAVEFDVNELLLMTGGINLDEFSSRLGQFLVTAAQSD